jgi:hypothetical protein
MNSNGLIDIEKASHEELLQEYEDCQQLWGKYSCDCFGFYIGALHKEIVKRGGWPSK